MPHSFLLLFMFLLLVMFLLPLRGELTCKTTSCGEIKIQFPFGLRLAKNNETQTQTTRRCSYPRFQLSCDDSNRTILSVPGSGDLVVKSIDYKTQTVKVNDPEGCLAKRYLQNLSISLHPPFTFEATVYDLTFLRCPLNVTKRHPLLQPISCLNSSSSSSVVFPWGPHSDTSAWHDECDVITSAFVPIPHPENTTTTSTSFFALDLNNDVALKWSEPACGDCEGRGQVCGFTGDASLQVGCLSSTSSSSTPNGGETQGLSRSAKYGLTIGVGIPGLLCLTGLCCFMCSKFDVYTHSHRARPSTELPSSITLPLPPFTMGLNGPEIEKFPKTLIGESGRLPNSNDNTCPICLSEYEPKETLRTIPACNHYFHAHCVDEWLKMNATCPLCRNSPEPSSTVTPSSSSLSIYSSLP